MRKEMTCIVCPNSCHLLIDIQDGKVSKVSGNKCIRGEEFAKQEIENPQRIFTGTIKAENLALKMIPVRTDHSIPKAQIPLAIQTAKKMIQRRPVKVGEIIVANFLGLAVNLIATRSVDQ
jgi:CxxC motif-containing protein